MPIPVPLGDVSIDPGALKLLRERGGTWACYQNCDLGDENLGRLQFLQYGQGCAFEHPPDRAPDAKACLGWRYVHAGYVNLHTGEIVATPEEASTPVPSGSEQTSTPDTKQNQKRKHKVKIVTVKGQHRAFVAFVPASLGEIWTEWDPRVPEILKQFPANIVYGSDTEFRMAVYEPDFASWAEDSKSARLTYRLARPSRFRVEVSIEKSNGRYRVKKYQGRKVICASYGPTLKGVMTYATMIGLRDDEPCSFPLREG